MARAFVLDTSFRRQPRNVQGGGRHSLADLLTERERPTPAPAPEPEPAPATPPQAVGIDAAELAQRLERCAEDARSAALAEAEAASAAQLARASEAIAASLGAEVARRGASQRQDAERLLQLVGAIAQRLIPAAVERLPLEDLADALRALCARLDAQPQVTIAVHARLAEDLAQLLPKLAVEAGFDGRIDVVTATDLAVGDARVDWPSGRAERRLDQMVDDAVAVCAGWLAETASTPNPPPSPANPEGNPS